MAGFYNLDHKEVIRIKVKKCDGKVQPEYKKFSIDPQITSFEMLQGILARAFDIHSDFTISYLARDSEGQAVYLSMLSDWDMDAAFQCAADPCLKLKVDLRPFEEELEDWDVIAPAEIPQHRISSLLDKNSILGSITGTISHNLGRTVNSMQRVMGLKHADNEIKPLKPPMSDMEFHNYLDSAGFMIRPNEFRLSIYQGGIEPSLRRVAWRHLLNVYPANMSGKDRFDYMKRKEEEYRKLRDEWRERFRNNTATEEVKYVASMVKKDVLRTDRSHGFYAGSDENENTLSLFHILVTYALTHPDVSYCQGMSDLASPLLVTQKDEGQAYVCFCALMNRLRHNFTVDGSAIMTKFRHLSEVLAMYDPALSSYLSQISAGDLFFSYRWFLLELKREFPFTDALYVLEVMWATLPPAPPAGELGLVDPDYSCKLLSSSPCSPSISFQHAMYAKLLAMRRVGAMHRVAPAALPIPSPVPRASVNNNLSMESVQHLSDSTVTRSGVSSFDTSPGDLEDRGAEFPEVDNPLTRSMQRKSNSIDQVLQEGPCLDNGEQELDGENRGEGEHNGDVVEEADIPEDNDVFEERDLVDGYKKDHFGSGGRDSFTNLHSHSIAIRKDIQVGARNARTDAYYNEVDTALTSVPVEDGRGFQFTESGCDVDCVDKSFSASSVLSESSETSEQQVQFSLSLDTNANNSLEILDGPEDPQNEDTRKNTMVSEPQRNNIIYIKSEAQECTDRNNSNSDVNAGIFQSMRRLLTSPKRKTGCSPAPDSDSSPTSSPKKSTSLAGRHTPSAPVLSPASEKQCMTKNYSDSHISDCHEATESLESSVGSGSTSSPSSRPPVRDPSKLPPPQEFGAGNPFLMFVSLTLLIQHRDTVIRGGMCYEEIAMHFDRLVRRHNAQRVLHHARQMYTEYLRAQQANLEKQKEADELGLSC